ncbi:MAG TPA: hypothetical protein VKZ18_07650 [Polyangia bacterium]|nr:hypothetical protein [Polyangia bacterium]
MKTKLLGALLLVVTAVGCGNLNDNLGTAIYVRYTPDGRLVVFGGDRVDVYSPDLSTLEARIPAPAPSTATWPYTDVFSLSDDGNVAVVVHPNQTHNHAELYSLTTFQKTLVDLGPLPDASQPNLMYDDQPDDVALSPQGDLLFVMGGLHSTTSLMQMFDTSTGQNLWTTDWEITPVFSPDGSRMYAIGGAWDSSSLQGFDARTGAVTLDATTASWLGRIGMMADPSTVVALTTAVSELSCGSTISPCSPQITSYSTVDGSATAQLALQANTIASETVFRCSSAAGLCAVGVAVYDPVSSYGPIGWEVQVWSMAGTFLQSVETAFNDVSISPDGQFLAVAQGSKLNNGDAVVYRISDGSLVRTLHYGGSGPL